MNGNNEKKCFHCSLPVPEFKNNSSIYSVKIDGEDQSMCCPGCQAVTQAIVDSGLTGFYRYRTDASVTAQTIAPEVLKEIILYDNPEIQRSFVSKAGFIY